MKVLFRVVQNVGSTNLMEMFTLLLVTNVTATLIDARILEMQITWSINLFIECEVGRSQLLLLSVFVFGYQIFTLLQTTLQHFSEFIFSCIGHILLIDDDLLSGILLSGILNRCNVMRIVLYDGILYYI